MKQIDELTMNSIGFAILCNFPRFCGMERAKEASKQFCAIKEELLAYRAIGAPEELRTLLQEKAHREQGCEYCDFSSGSCGAIFDGEDDFFLVTPDNLHEFYIATDGQGVFRETQVKFCPICGRKLDGGGEDE